MCIIGKTIALLLFVDVIVLLTMGDIRCFTTTCTFKDNVIKALVYMNELTKGDSLVQK